MKRGGVIKNRKTRRLLIVAMVAVSLVAVALPLCGVGLCSASSPHMAGMASHSSLPTILRPMASAACDMTVAVGNLVDGALPAASTGLLAPIAAMMALLAAVALVVQRSPLRATALARSSSPPGDPRGVCLLN
jgi:hypothetical protein